MNTLFYLKLEKAIQNLKNLIQLVWLISLFITLLSCEIGKRGFSGMEEKETKGYLIPISWFDELRGDFSFSNKWKFTDGIYLNDYQQIICWKCPPRPDKMLDKRRKIIADSMAIFYKLIDSTRHYFSLDSRSTLTDMNGNHFISVKKYGEFTLEGFTNNNDGVNCSFFFRIKDDFIDSWIYVKDNSKTKIYYLKEGKFFADKKAFEKEILKAKFSFIYQSENGFKPLYWSGKIYAKILGV